jgi:hypothetical protein
MSIVTLTRQQLYDRAWTTPIDTLATELGLSGRGLGKVCARHDIPVPPRGYWAKKAFGKHPIKPALPSPGTYGQRIAFNVVGGAEEADVENAAMHPLVAFEALAENRIAVPEDLPLSDPLVLTTQKRLMRAKREVTGLIALPERALPIHTSRALRERALRIMQALLAGLAARAFPVAMTNDGVRVTILDESLAFVIVESLKQVQHRVSFSEQRLIDRGAGWQVPKTDSVPTGSLSLAITNVRHVRQRWSESTGRPLESLLNRFLVGLVRAALGLKKQRADAERRERERQEEEKKRLEEARRQEAAEQRWREEQAKVERLERLADLWQQNQRSRQLIAAVKDAVGAVETESELGRWLAWADRRAESSDPLRRLRERSGKTIALYYQGYDEQEIKERGFSEPKLSGYGNETTKPGVKLTERPPQRTYYEHGLKLELPEDVVLPYEWIQESDWLWRAFRVPADVLNRALGYGEATRTGVGLENGDQTDLD